MSGGIVCKEKFLYVVILDQNFGHGVLVLFSIPKKYSISFLSLRKQNKSYLFVIPCG